MLIIKRNEVFYLEVFLNSVLFIIMRWERVLIFYLFELLRSFFFLLFGYLFVGKRGNLCGFS